MVYFFVLRPVVSYGTQRPRGLFLPLFSRPRKRKKQKVKKSPISELPGQNSYTKNRTLQTK